MWGRRNDRIQAIINNIFVIMAQLNSLEKWGIVASAGLVLYVVKFVCGVFYTYVVGPAVNKVDFKSKGKWARECIIKL